MSAADRRLDGLEHGPVQLPPQTLHIDVTNSCNTDCVTCWDHSPHLATPRPASWKRQRVDVDAVRALLDDVQTLDVPAARLQAVILSGMGEPFTHKDIYALIADVKRRGLHLTIITNLVAADVDRVVDLGVDSLLVGVQGASEGSYLAFHPSFLPAHWALLNRQLARLAEAGGVDVKHVQVICRDNAHELVDMIDLAAATRAARVNFKLASLHKGTEAVRITAAQRALLQGSLVQEAAARAAARGVATNLDVLAAQLRAGRDDVDEFATAPVGDVGCFVGAFYARVAVDGTVLFCCNTDVVVGNLRDLPFSQWWRSARWEHWRRRMRQGRYLESCAQCGKINQNVAWSARARARFGDERWRAMTGRGSSSSPPSSPSPSSSSPAARAARRRGALPVLP
jgi:MoaA/NifB/PqqE/SkfB family radical SAM enzyme